MVRLKPRLKVLSDMLEPCDVVADVGCDHGKLAVSLIQSGRAKRVLASDISPFSVIKTQKLAQKCGLSDKIDVTERDGLIGLGTQPNAIIIAGMGGILITDIIKSGGEYSKNADQLLLQPMRGVKELRKFLHDECYHVNGDRLVFDEGRIYQVISAHYVGKKQEFPKYFPSNWYEIGFGSVDDPLTLDLLDTMERELREGAYLSPRENIRISAEAELERIEILREAIRRKHEI